MRATLRSASTGPHRGQQLAQFFHHYPNVGATLAFNQNW
jgi:hypothetical protein